MKTSHLIPYLMTIAVVTGCIKEDGEPYTIERQIDKERTIVSSLSGYMYGTAQKDTIVENSFQVLENNDLDVYMALESYFDTIEVQYNAVKECGYVYSSTNSSPTVKGKDCNTFKKENISWNGDTSNTSLRFSGEVHGLEFNHNYYLRSYVVTTHGDTCYNPTICQTMTVEPSNVWFRRKEAKLSARTEAITAITDGGQTYIYGGRDNVQCFSDMWIYNTNDDTWTQLATCEESSITNSRPVNRCNGAAFMYTKSGMDADTLMYILGGEDVSGTPTKFNFIYSLKYNRFGNSADHPNGRQYVEPFDQPRTGLIAFKIETEWNEPFYLVGMGLTQIEGTSSTAIDPQIKQYNVTWDALAYLKDAEGNIKKDEKGNPIIDERHVHSWTTLGSLSTDGKTAIDQTTIGFYQSIVVKINSKQVIIGSGEGSDGNYSNSFYQVKLNSSDASLEIVKKFVAPEDFVPRKNAAAFYLEYDKKGQKYNKFFVGTGRDKDGRLLNDFWAYNFGNAKSTWERIADCGNYCREGAVGFKILRIDDYFTQEYQEPHERGIVALGRGYKIGESNEEMILQDVWEYLP